MPTYVILDENKNYLNTIICEEDDWINPDYTKILMPPRSYWNTANNSIEKIPFNVTTEIRTI